MAVVFGLFSDLHYSGASAPQKDSKARSLSDLRASLRRFREKEVNFAVSLGDLTHTAGSREKQLSVIREITGACKSQQYPVYYCVGNHEFTELTPAEVKRAYDIHRFCYRFEVEKVRFLVLDTNYNPDGTHFSENNFDWTKSIINEEQIAWLKGELSTCIPTVIFTHGNLYREISKPGDGDYIPLNADKVLDIINEAGCVKAVFQGHHHDESLCYRLDVPFYNIPSPVSAERYMEKTMPVFRINDDFTVEKLQ